MGKVRFDFYYGADVEEFAFYRIPRLLFTDEFFRGLSCEAKVLYGLMRDRMTLSRKNGWIDEQNRVYIIFTLEEVMDYLGCGKDKGVKILAELDSEKGIGLIERVKRGMGKPTIIYVKTFLREAEAPEPGTAEEPIQLGTVTAVEDAAENRSQEFGETEVKSSEKPKSRLLKNRSQEFGETEVKSSEKSKSGVLENRSQEFGKTDSNHIYRNHMDTSYTNPIYPSISSTGERTDEIDEIEAYRQLIRTNIEYDSFMQSCDPAEVEDVREIYGLICEVVCVPRETIRIAGEDYPYEIVKSQYLKLDADDIRYVRHCMQQTTTKIRNIKAYLQTALFNAPNTKGHFYGALAQHDLYGDGS